MLGLTYNLLDLTSCDSLWLGLDLRLLGLDLYPAGLNLHLLVLNWNLLEPGGFDLVLLATVQSIKNQEEGRVECFIPDSKF